MNKLLTLLNVFYFFENNTHNKQIWCILDKRLFEMILVDILKIICYTDVSKHREVVMDTYKGIAPDEYLLKAEMIGFIVLLVISLGLLIGYAVITFRLRDRKNEKEMARMRLLAERAENDPIAKKQLERKLRKQENRKRCEKSQQLSDILIFTIAFLLICGSLWGVITRTADYTKKDYMVYEGTVTVHRQLRRSTVTLSDGTVLWCKGSQALEMEDQERVVIAYAKRSDIVVGFREADVA